MKKDDKKTTSQETVAVVADSIASNGGNIRISENVIASVVKKYTLETPGVIRFVTTSLVSGLAEMIGRKNHESNVEVELDGAMVNISVTLVLQFGVSIPETAGMVQSIIRSKVEELTGMQVTNIDVIVQDLEDLEEEKEDEVEEAIEE